MSCACSGRSAMKRTPVRRKPPAIASWTTNAPRAISSRDPGSENCSSTSVRGATTVPRGRLMEIRRGRDVLGLAELNLAAQRLLDRENGRHACCLPTLLEASFSSINASSPSMARVPGTQKQQEKFGALSG